MSDKLIERLKQIVGEIHREWNNDNDSRVGKLLIALYGGCPTYRADITAFLNDIERLQSELAEEKAAREKAYQAGYATALAACKDFKRRGTSLSLRARVEAGEKVVRELVRLEDLKDSISTEDNWTEIAAEYREAKPLAWKAARAFLAE